MLARLMAVVIVSLLAVILQISSVSAAAGAPRIVINIAARTLSHYAGDILIKEYPIAVGRATTPSPQGEYQVIEKMVDPWWFPTTPGMPSVPSGPDNPLGYRWIGFAATYGIHGTNSPWSIGTAASQGCIRMYEEDVEELFPQILLGTPVSIVYDTVRVAADKQGSVYVTVYKDIYGYGTSTLSRVRQKLAAIGAEDLISDADIRQLLQDKIDAPLKIGKLVNVKVNDGLLAVKGILSKDTVYVPAAAIAQMTGATIVVEARTGSIKWQDKTVPLLVGQSGIYVGLWKLPELLGAQCAYDETTATAFIEVVRIHYNGKPLAVRTQVVEGIIALPLTALLEAAGLRTESQPGEVSISVNGREIPAVMHEGVPYLQITRIQDALNMYVYYDTTARLIHLTYIPFIAGGP